MRSAKAHTREGLVYAVLDVVQVHFLYEIVGIDVESTTEECAGSTGTSITKMLVDLRTMGGSDQQRGGSLRERVQIKKGLLINVVVGEQDFGNGVWCNTFS